MAIAFESQESISSPQGDIEQFKRKVEKHSQSSFGRDFEKVPEKQQEEIVKESLREHIDLNSQKVTPEYAALSEKAEAVVLALSPDEDDPKMEELLGLVEEVGVLNTVKAIEKTESFHILDDFHRLLVQYLKSGYPVNIKESAPIYPGLKMTLYEIYLPENPGEDDSQGSLEQLLSSMEQFYAGMFSVAENTSDSQYFTIEIAYPQGRDEVVLFCAVPDKKKGIFRNQVLAIFPEAVIKENTDDYNIFNKSDNIKASRLVLSKGQALPIKDYKSFNYDPLNIVLQSFSGLEKNEGAAIQIVLSPESPKINDKILKAIDRISKGEDIESNVALHNFSAQKVFSTINSFLFQSQNSKEDNPKDQEKRQSVMEQMRAKNSSRLYRSNIRLLASGNSLTHAEMVLSELESAFFQFENSLGNSFFVERIKDKKIKEFVEKYTFRVFDKDNFSYLNITELTSIFHFPKVKLGAKNILSGTSSASAAASRKVSALAAENQAFGVNQNLAQKRVFSKSVSDFSQIPQRQKRTFSSNENSLPEAQKEKQKDFFDQKSQNTFSQISTQEQNFSKTSQDSSAFQEPHFVASDPYANTPEVHESPSSSGLSNMGDASFSNSKGVLLGINSHQGVETPIYLKPMDRMRHMYVIGQTGTGKTTLLKNMIVQDIQNGEGVCFIDPHGSDVEDILANVPPERFDDVIYFDTTNFDHPMALNLMEYDPKYPEQKSFVIDEILGIFKKLYADVPESMGPAFEQYFRNSTALVMEDPQSGNTMIEIARVLSDASFRNMKLARSKNMIVNQFWEKIATQAQGEASLENIVPYITNKFDVFLSNDLIRPVIAQDKSSFNFREIMDERKILLVNLAKGKIGDKNANLIGMIIVGKFLAAALSRVDSLDKNLPPFYLYMDEFQNVTTDSISAILSEARKYKLSLNIAHQFIRQIDEKIKDSVFGNVGSMAVFRVGQEDAEFLESQFKPTFTAQDIVNIPNRNAYLKLLVDGEPQKPFNISTMKPKEGNPENAKRIKELSIQKYGGNRAEIEEKIQAKFKALM